jgi:antitoxin (DNA-binding transcriptional repressor) of toxin-antitoxin stability system
MLVNNVAKHWHNKSMAAKHKTVPQQGRVVSSAYAQTNFGEILKEVAKGNIVTVQRYNTPVAIISPPSPPEKRVPKFGTGKGIKILDPNWADPMTEEELEEILKNRY